MPGATRIAPRRPRRIYLAEWRERRGLSQKTLGERLGVANMSVSRWERGTALLSTDVMAAIAEALDIEPVDLYRHPDQPSLDALMRGQPQHIRDQAVAIVKAIRKD
jgi:transcriptional regulator with XRE-family HTH domain